MEKSKPKSQLMMTKLEMSYEKVAHFLGTLCIQKAYHLFVEELHDDDDNRLKTSDLMLQDEYVSGWQKNASSPNSAEG
jgi:hypothetical protein